jgi:hypothetical protein
MYSAHLTRGKPIGVHRPVRCHSCRDLPVHEGVEPRDQTLPRGLVVVGRDPLGVLVSQCVDGRHRHVTGVSGLVGPDVGRGCRRSHNRVKPAQKQR